MKSPAHEVQTIWQRVFLAALAFGTALLMVCISVHPSPANASSFGDPMADGTKYCPPTLTAGYSLYPTLERSCPGSSPVNCVANLVKVGILTSGFSTAKQCGESNARKSRLFICDFAGGDCYPNQCQADMAISLGAYGLLENALNQGDIAIPVTTKAVPPADLALTMANSFVGFEVKATYLKLYFAADANVMSTCGDANKAKYESLRTSIRSRSQFKLTVRLTQGFSFGKGYFGKKWDQAAKADEVQSMGGALAVAIAQAYAARARTKKVSFAWTGAKSKKRSNGSVEVTSSFSPGGGSVGTTITLDP